MASIYVEAIVRVRVIGFWAFLLSMLATRFQYVSVLLSSCLLLTVFSDHWAKLHYFESSYLNMAAATAYLLQYGVSILKMLSTYQGIHSHSSRHRAQNFLTLEYHILGLLY